MNTGGLGLGLVGEVEGLGGGVEGGGGCGVRRVCGHAEPCGCGNVRRGTPSMEGLGCMGGPAAAARREDSLLHGRQVFDLHMRTESCSECFWVIACSWSAEWMVQICGVVGGWDNRLHARERGLVAGGLKAPTGVWQEGRWRASPPLETTVRCCFRSLLAACPGQPISIL